MRVILTIGHTDILLPNDKGLSTLIRTLSSGVKCVDRSYKGEITVGDPIEISFKTVSPRTQFKRAEDAAPEEREYLGLPEPRSIQL